MDQNSNSVSSEAIVEQEIKNIPFINLHQHSTRSNLIKLDAYGTTEQIVERGKEINYPYIVLTDHGGISGWYSLYKTCKSNGVKPLFGCELYVVDSIEKQNEFKAQGKKVKVGTDDAGAEDELTDKEKEKLTKNDIKRYHLLAIAETQEGMENLQHLVTLAWNEGFYYRPSVDWELLKKYGKGIIFSTACEAGKVNNIIKDILKEGGSEQQAIDKASEYLLEMKQIFPDENQLFAELMPIERNRHLHTLLYHAAKKANLPIIATCDSHYPRKEDSMAQDLLICIGDKTFFKDPNRRQYDQGEFYMKSGQEMFDSMKNIFPHIPDEEIIEILGNTIKIGERCCNLKLAVAPIVMFPMDDGENKYTYFLDLVTKGWEARDINSQLKKWILKKHNTNGQLTKERFEELFRERVAIYKDRIRTELDCIIKKGFLDYFLITRDIIKYAQQEGILTGPGRGCFLPENKVLLANGKEKFISDLNIGDKVISKNLTPEKIVNKFEYEIEEDIIKLIYGTKENGLENYMTLTKDHEILVLEETGESIWKKAKDLKIGEKVLKPINNKIKREIHCDSCDAVFSNNYNLTFHKNTKHFLQNMELYGCPVCENHFKNYSGLQYHLQHSNCFDNKDKDKFLFLKRLEANLSYSLLNKESFEYCKECGLIFNSLNGLKQHLYRTHNIDIKEEEIEILQDILTKEVEKNKKFDLNNFTVVDLISYLSKNICIICNKSFEKRISLHNHLRQNIDENHKELFNVFNTNKKEILENSEESYECPHCTLVTSAYNTYCSHLSKVHGIKNNQNNEYDRILKDLPKNNDFYNNIHKGTYYSSKCDVNIRYESGIELLYILLVEMDDSVIRYERHPYNIDIPYVSLIDKKTHRYIPDFIQYNKDGTVEVVEIKDKRNENHLDVVQKKIAGVKYCEENNFSYSFYTKSDLVSKIKQYSEDSWFKIKQDFFKIITKSLEKDFNPSLEKDYYENYEICYITQKQSISYKGLVYDIEVENENSFICNNIVVHNSAAGSLVTYLIDITEVDPIPYDLFFQRFIDFNRGDTIFQINHPNYKLSQFKKEFDPILTAKKEQFKLQYEQEHNLKFSEISDKELLGKTERDFNKKFEELIGPEKEANKEKLKELMRVSYSKYLSEHPEDAKMFTKSQQTREMWLICDNNFTEYTLELIKKFESGELKPIDYNHENSWFLYTYGIYTKKPTGDFECIITDMPDIDTDFQDDRREEVVEYLKRKYGYDNVSYISTFGEFGGKNTLLDIARTFNIPGQAIETISRLLVQRSGGDSRASFTIEDTINNFDAAKEVVQQYPDILHAAKLQGQYRQIGIHASGVVIHNDPLYKYGAVYVLKGKPTICWDKKAAESLGLMKQDLLGLNTLRIIKEALGEIKRTTGIEIDPYKIPLDDKITLDGFQKNDLFGVFQFEGESVYTINRQIVPRNFEQVADVTALSRPGALNCGGTAKYIACNNGSSEPEYYGNDLFQRLTGDAYGVILYQEQVMIIMREMGLMSWRETSEIRRLISKSEGVERFQMYFSKFKEGCESQGIKKEVYETIWSDICKYGSFCFNKSHSISYSVLTFIAMYLKQHYPNQFYYALARASTSDDKVLRILQEYKKRGNTLLACDINKSGETFTVDKDDGFIRIGFGNLKGVGEKAAAVLVEERDTNGPFKDYKDFYDRVQKRTVNSGVRKKLKILGVFNSIGGYSLEDEEIKLLKKVGLIKKEKTKEEKDLETKVSKAKKKQEELKDLDLTPVMEEIAKRIMNGETITEDIKEQMIEDYKKMKSDDNSNKGDIKEELKLEDINNLNVEELGKVLDMYIINCINIPPEMYEDGAEVSKEREDGADKEASEIESLKLKLEELNKEELVQTFNKIGIKKEDVKLALK